jgi:hypothetical protein
LLPTERFPIQTTNRDYAQSCLSFEGCFVHLKHATSGCDLCLWRKAETGNRKRFAGLLMTCPNFKALVLAVDSLVGVAFACSRVRDAARGFPTRIYIFLRR